MGKTRIRLLILLGLVTHLLACGGNGTEIGNPGTKRSISGTLALTQTAGLTTPGTTESCPDANGPVTVVLATPSGAQITTDLSDSGTFLTDIDQQERYEVLFQQNGATCAQLNYGPTQNYSGLHVIIGRGTRDINLGQITDQGNAVYFSSNDASSFCDDDGDGIPDNIDPDANGDGIKDNDNDGDGYLDWFFSSESAETNG